MLVTWFSFQIYHCTFFLKIEWTQSPKVIRQSFYIEDFHELFICKLRSRESSAPVKNQWNYSLQFLTELDIQRGEVDEHVNSQKWTASGIWIRSEIKIIKTMHHKILLLQKFTDILGKVLKPPQKSASNLRKKWGRFLVLSTLRSLLLNTVNRASSFNRDLSKDVFKTF